MSAEHPLADKEVLKIYECVDFPMVLPKRPQGIRQILDTLAANVGITIEPAVESNSLDLLRLMSQESEALSFCLAINRRPELAKVRLVAVPVDLQGIPSSVLVAGHLRGRALPVAAARFLESVIKELEQ